MAPFIVAWFFFILIGYAIGSGKGRGAEGFLLGLLLGLIGVIIAGFMKPSVAIQAKRDVELERAREAERERWREEGRAQARAEMQTPTVRTEIGRPPGE